MTDITQLGYPSGFLGLDDNQSQSNPSNLGNTKISNSKYSNLITNDLLDSLKSTESSGNPYAVNKDTKAMGAYQHLPETVQMLHKQGIEYNPFNENEQRQATKQYLVQLLDKNKGDLNAALAQYGGFKTKDPSGYIQKVTSNAPDTQIASDSPFALPQDTTEYKPYKAPTTKPAQGQQATQPTTLQGAKQDITEFYQKNKMTPEEFEKQSLLSPLTKTLVGVSTGNVGLVKNAIQDYVAKSETGVRGIGDLISNVYEHPKEVLKQISEHPAEVAAGLVKGVIYNPTLNPLALKPSAGAVEGLAANVARAPKIEKATTVVAPEVEKLTQATSTDTPTYLRKQFAEKQGIVTPTAEAITEPDKVTTEIPVPQEKPPRPTIPVNDAKAAETEKLLRDVGVEKVRLSALNEDPLEATSQYLTSQADKGIYGTGMKEQIAHEKNALENHFGNIEKEIGGSIPTDVVGEIERGQKVKKALDEAQTAHELETKRLYNKATEELGDNQVQLNNFENYINKKSNFVHGPEQNLRSGVRSYLDEQGLIDKEGKISPMSVKQSEDLRQFINSQYNYETGNKVGNLVKTIDGDVFSNVGTKTYEEARAHFRTGKQTYDEPKAIKDLLSNEGVNQKIADEKVMTKISTLDESQFKHLIDTLKQNGKEDAIKEIQTNLVHRIKESGKSADLEPWNSIAAAKERQARSAKLQKAFKDNPEMLERINKGVLAGNKLYIPTKYKGAGVQTHLLHTKFGDFIGKGLTYAGWKSGLHGGALIGDVTGRALNTYLSKGKQAKQLEKEIKDIQLTNISDIGK